MAGSSRLRVTWLQGLGFVVPLAITLASLWFVAARAEAIPTTERVSVGPLGIQGNGSSLKGVLSGNARFAGFISLASNLAQGDTNDTYDVFVSNLTTGSLSRVNVSSSGAQANKESLLGGQALSDDGRLVAFSSHASNLVFGDTNDLEDIFVRDRRGRGSTTRVSVSSSGAQAEGTSFKPSISANGRFVAFVSHASNLVGRDTNDNYDVFVHDRVTGTTRRVSLNSSEKQGNGPSGYVQTETEIRPVAPAISADGRYVAFCSLATNLVGRDTNGATDIFVRDLQAGTTRRVNVSAAGKQTNDPSYDPAISTNGRYVAFGSSATNLVPGDTNDASDVFVRDLQAGTTRRVSVTRGKQANDSSGDPAISANGRYVAFGSLATNLVAGDTNDASDVFVRDLEAGKTRRVSVSSGGDQGGDHSAAGSLTANGQTVAFASFADNLVPGDTNSRWDIFVRHLR
jgi:Tol biopolymer transport system component